MSKLITAEQAAALIPDGATVVNGSMGLAGWPEAIGRAMLQRFETTGSPKNITFCQGSSIGDWKERGTTKWGHEGFVKRWIGAHIGASAGLSKLLMDNKMEAYCLPQGVLINLWREIAAKRPGLLTKVGLRTFVDPRVEGGKMNAATSEDIVKVVKFEGEEYLFFKAFHLDVAILRASTADENGNLTLEKEMMLHEILPIAQAVRNCGGTVIVQVENLVKAGTLHPKSVRVPGILVDHIVVADDKADSWQTEGRYYEPSFDGSIKIPLSAMPKFPLNERKIIARRAALELHPGAIVNLGVGMPADVAAVAADEGISDSLTLTAESGGIGGIPASPPDFGASYNAQAIIEHNAMFDFYDGGGLDLTFLGLAQTDKHGNVNVTKFGRPMGAGGFINISQNAKKVVYTGTFTAGGLKVAVEGGKLSIVQEGKTRKFIDHVEQITFSGEYASEIKQPVFYVTERAVFTLVSGAMTLIEIAPGIDLERDILAQMDFKPIISPNLKTMPEGIFMPEWGGLKAAFTNR